jgi:hypothetical protein
VLTLHRLSLSYRLLYTFVLLFMTAGTAAHSVHQELRAGLAPREVAAWYRGNEEQPDAAVFLFPKSFEEVFEDVWEALTTYTLALLIFGGILMRSDTAPKMRAGLVGGYALGGLLAAAAPLLVRYVTAGFAPLLTAVLFALPALALAMSVVGAREIWFRRTAGPRIDPARKV